MKFILFYFGSRTFERLLVTDFVTDFLWQCVALFLVAFTQNGIWFLRFWLLNLKSRNVTNESTNEHKSDDIELDNETKISSAFTIDHGQDRVSQETKKQNKG